MNSLYKSEESWTTVKEIRAQMLRLWDRGDLLRAVLDQALSTSDVELSLIHI